MSAAGPFPRRSLPLGGSGAQRRRGRQTAVVHADDVTPVPWKNGGGITRDLFADAIDWRWRISLADIAVDGPFSDYPGVERWFSVIEGRGVELRFRDASHALRVGDEPLRFDGAHGPGCRLLEGPTRDLNLLLRDGVRGAMRRTEPGVAWAEDWPWRAHFDIATRTLEWGLPPGALTGRGAGLWIGIAP